MSVKQNSELLQISTLDPNNNSSALSDQDVFEIVDSKLFIHLNAIVLQYLEILGLNETIGVFQNECKVSGYPLPASLATCKAGSEEKIRLRDLELLFKHFNDENWHAMLEKWDFVSRFNHEYNEHFASLGTNLRIYAHVTLPYRRNLPPEKKKQSIQSLLDHFKARTQNNITDAEVLSLYALPHVVDPTSHPVFSKFFTRSWVDSVRYGLKEYCRSLCRLCTNPLDSDIGKLYILWTHSTCIMNEFLFKIQRYDSHQYADVQMCSEFQNKRIESEKRLPRNFPFLPFFNGIHELVERVHSLQENERIMRKDFDYKIQLCDSLVSYLQSLHSDNKAIEISHRNYILELCSKYNAREFDGLCSKAVVTGSSLLSASTPTDHSSLISHPSSTLLRDTSSKGMVTDKFSNSKLIEPDVQPVRTSETLCQRRTLPSEDSPPCHSQGINVCEDPVLSQISPPPDLPEMQKSTGYNGLLYGLKASRLIRNTSPLSHISEESESNT